MKSVISLRYDLQVTFYSCQKFISRFYIEISNIQHGKSLYLVFVTYILRHKIYKCELENFVFVDR